MLGAVNRLSDHRFGQHADIEDLETGQVQRCNLRRGIESLVSGTGYYWRKANQWPESLVVEAVEPGLMLTRRTS